MVLPKKESKVCVLGSRGQNLFHKASSPIRLLQLSFRAEGRCIIRSYIKESTPSLPSTRILYKPASLLLSSSVGITGSACKWLCCSTYASRILVYISKPALLAFQSTLSPSAQKWLLEAIEKSLFQLHLVEWTSPISIFISDVYPTIHPVLSKINSVIFAVFRDGETIIPFQGSLTPSCIELFHRVALSLGNVISKIQTSLHVASSAQNAWVQKLLYRWLMLCKSLCISLVRSLKKANGKTFIEILEDFFDELDLDPCVRKSLITLVKSTQRLICKKGPAILNFLRVVSPRVWKLFRTVTPIAVDIFRRISILLVDKIRQYLPQLSKCMVEAICTSALSTATQAGTVLQSVGKVLLPLLGELSVILYTNLCIVYPELSILARGAAPQVWLLIKDIWPRLSKGACYAFGHLWPFIWCFICENAGDIQTGIISAYPHVLTLAEMTIRVIVTSVNCLLICSPIIGAAIHEAAQCWCTVISALIPLLWAASHEVAPVLWEDFVLVMCSAFCRVAPSLISAAQEVTPVLCRAQLEVMWAVWFALCEVCPVLYTAAVEVTPVVNEAFWTIAPVTCIAISVVAATLWKACIDEVAPKALCAACVVAPHFWKAFCAVNAATQRGAVEICSASEKAAREISYVFASAGIEVAKVTQTAILEMCRVSDVALEEVALAWQSAFEETIVITETLSAHHLARFYSTSSTGVSSFSKHTVSNFHYSLHSLNRMSFKFNRRIHLSWLPRIMQRSAVTILYLLEIFSHQGKKPIAAFIQTLSPVIHKSATVLLNSTLFALKQTVSSISTCAYRSFTVSFVCSVSFSLLFYVLEMSLSAEYQLCLILGAAHQLASTDMHSLLRHLILRLGPPAGRLIFKGSLKTWKRVCVLVSKCWDLTEKCSPYFWSVVCQVSPLVFEAICSMNRTMWIAVCRASPQLWDMICIYSPCLWAVVCFLCPLLWSSTCETISMFWSVFCEICPLIWAILCLKCPVLWHSFLKINAFVWESFCVSSACLWDVMCKTSAVTWHSSCWGVATVWNCSCPAVYLAWSTSSWTINTMWTSFRVTCPLALKLLWKVGSSVQMAVVFVSWSKTLVFNPDELFSFSDFLAFGMCPIKKACLTSSVVSLVVTARCTSEFPQQLFRFPMFRVPFAMALKALSVICEVVRSETCKFSSIDSRVVNFLSGSNMFAKRLPTVQKISHKLSAVCSKGLFVLNGL